MTRRFGIDISILRPYFRRGDTNRWSETTMDLQAYVHPAELPESETTRVARLLAIDGPETLSDEQLARHVTDGLFPQAAMVLSDVVGRSRIIHWTRSCPRRRSGGCSRPGKGCPETIVKGSMALGRVVDALGRAYQGDREAIDRFLNQPHPLLEGQTPFNMARSSSAGTEAVFASHSSGRGWHRSLRHPRKLPETMQTNGRRMTRGIR